MRQWHCIGRLGSDFCLEAVSTARNSLDQTRPVIADCPAQFPNALDQCVIGDDNVGPRRREQVLLRYKMVCVFDEMQENRERLWT
jgi:hypothetical protein